MIKVLYKIYIDFTIVLCPLYCKSGFVRGGRNEKREGERKQGVGEGRRETNGNMHSNTAQAIFVNRI